DQPPIGPIYASITEYGGYLYVGSADGHLYCLQKDGTERWVYPSKTADPPLALAEISSTAAFGDNIYIATGGYHGGQMGWPKTSEGRIICIKDDLMLGAQLQWVYPAMGASPAGSFLYASPLWMSPLAADTPGVFLGSLDGYFYGVDAAGTPASLITSDKWPRINVGGSMRSSPAGTRAGFPALDNTDPNNPVLVPRASEIGMAFVNAGDTIYALDLTTGEKESWSWQLMGPSISSPAIYNARIYTGDGAGYMWAFSSREVAGGAEGWNTETGMEGPPTTGSENTDPNSQNLSRQAVPKIDVFTETEYEDFRKEAEISRGGPSRTNPKPIVAKWADPSDNSKTKGPPIIHEWGEDLYFIVWGILDPNQKHKDSDRWRWPGYEFVPDLDPPDVAFQQSIEGGHKVDVVIKSREPGKNADSTITHTLSGKSIDYFVSDTIMDPSGTHHMAVWYAAYPYVLDGSGRNDPQTPSSILNVYCQESPVSPDRRSETIWLENPDSTTDPKEPQQFAINNPLAVVYAESNAPCYIGVNNVLQTSKDRADAQVNGNGGEWPVVWGGITPHNKPSQTRTVIISDRSLLGTHRNSAGEPERKIIRFRMDRDALCWTGDASRAVNFIPVWEKPPQDQRLHGRRYANPDYPDIGVRQVAVNMAAGGQDPSQGIQELPPIDPTLLTDPITTWTVLADPVNVVINVPKYQPANMPDNPNSPSNDQLNASGYNGEIYAYVDSNDNGVFDGPARLGTSAVSAKSEAYREMGTKVHVPVDRRVELSPDRMDMGELPIGFGFTDNSGIPFAFLDNLMYNYPVGDINGGNISPAVNQNYGFHEWFQPFTAQNVGNTNLLDVQVQRTDLFSDTVQYPFYDLSATPPPVIPGSGHVVPYPCVVTTLDGPAIASPPAAGFPVEDRLGFYGASGIPPVPGMPLNQRTFHKPLVGSQPSELKLPDVALRFNVWNPNQFIPAGGAPVPQQAAVGVSLPIGQPAGTYYGKIRLWDLHQDSLRNLNWTPVSDPIEIVVKATEGRLTDGYPFDTDPHKAPHLPQLDVPGTPPTPGTGDAMPAAYRDRGTGDIHLFWASSRFAMDTASAPSVNPTASDPWYIYSSTLKTGDGPRLPGNWVEPSGYQQWWTPVTTGDIFPGPATINNYFPAPVTGDRRGGEGTVIPGSVRFSSPSIAVDESSGRSWLFFMGQASKDNSAAAVSSTHVQRTTESRVYYTELNDGQIDPGQVFSISPNTSGSNIAGDWTTPKFGVKGMVLKRAGGPSELWSFWYGGNA
ncbi:MAG TPA: PQQ-binding-like beta-propeller repeat protein, partial [Armatimonadota bacterium]|nr:PQQ-binding-like beta-propeller repeat protein [Armatimonadota bacterium]